MFSYRTRGATIVKLQYNYSTTTTMSTTQTECIVHCNHSTCSLNLITTHTNCSIYMLDFLIKLLCGD